jgi:hypothetical protein
MNQQLRKFSIPLLRWSVGLVVLLESVRFAVSSSAAHFLARAGLPAWVQPALGGAEMVAAILFLLPYTRALGGYTLLVIFALAVVIHVLHRQFDVAWLIVYAMAVIASMAHGEERNPEPAHDPR